MDPTERTPEPASKQAGQKPDIIRPGTGAVLMRLPDWFRKKRPSEPFTAAEKELLREWFRPVTATIMRDYEQRHDRQAVLELLPDWMYEKLPTNEPITEADCLCLRAHFALYHPELAERIDPVEVVRGWRYGCWYMRNHGHPAPTLPPRLSSETDDQLGGQRSHAPVVSRAD